MSFVFSLFTTPLFPLVLELFFFLFVHFHEFIAKCRMHERATVSVVSVEMESTEQYPAEHKDRHGLPVFQRQGSCYFWEHCIPQQHDDGTHCK